MTRLLASLFVLLFCTSAMASSENVALSGKTLIDGDVVTVGDLFLNTGSHAGYVLAPAPKAGDKLVLTKADFERVAQAFRLDWKAPASMPSVALERNASLVTIEAITKALNESDLKNQIKDDAKFTLNNIFEPVAVHGKDKLELVIKDENFDPEHEVFSATLQIMNKAGLVKEVALQGIATPIVAVPVLRYPLAAGSVISANDLVEVDYPKNQIRSDLVLFKSELVGMTVRRGTQANTVISRSDVSPPVMVKRNELVTVTYTSGAIQLSTKARALSAGTRGDIINFINVTSKKPFEAKVTGPQQAEVNLDG